MKTAFRIFSVMISLLASPAFALAGVAQKPGPATTYHCYKFTVSTHGEKNITDIHFSAVKRRRVPAKYMVTPVNWKVGVEANGDLVFQTPPDPIPAPHTASTPVENPVKPGDPPPLHRFRFCLPAPTDLKYSISYSDHTMAPQHDFGRVHEDGIVVSNMTLHCLKVHITAPDAPVFDVHFGSVDESNPKFDHVGLPTDWSGSATDDGLDVYVQTGTQPLPPGQSADVELCFEHVPPRIAWKFTDAQHQDIPGASGQARLHN